jgi:hypothetical protein
VTPPAITMLLSTSLNSTAIAQSGGRGDNSPTRGRSDDHHGHEDRDEDRHHHHREDRDHDHS